MGNCMSVASHWCHLLFTKTLPSSSCLTINGLLSCHCPAVVHRTASCWCLKNVLMSWSLLLACPMPTPLRVIARAAVACHVGDDVFLFFSCWFVFSPSKHVLKLYVESICKWVSIFNNKLIRRWDIERELFTTTLYMASTYAHWTDFLITVKHLH